MRIAEDRAGTGGIRLSLGNIAYIGSIETAERLAATLAEAIQEARGRRRVSDAGGGSAQL